MNNQPTEVRPLRENEWYGIGFQAETALTHAYWSAGNPKRRLTTAAEIGMPGMIRDGNVVEVDGGYRLTERGRQLLGQSPTLAGLSIRHGRSS